MNEAQAFEAVRELRKAGLTGEITWSATGMGRSVYVHETGEVACSVAQARRMAAWHTRWPNG